jgi:GxxExxY protein
MFHTSAQASGQETLEHEGHKEHEEREGLSLNLEALAHEVVDAGLKVHKTLGPGLLESAYEHCLAHELQRRGMSAHRQKVLPIIYEGLKLRAGYRLDLLIEDRLVVEVKAIDALTRVHEAQLATYLKLSGLKLGFLMNFNVPLFKHGLRRIAF